MYVIKTSLIILLGFTSSLLTISETALNISSTPACENNNCPDRHICRIIEGIPTCECSPGHEKNSKGQCVKQCETNRDCDVFREVCPAHLDTYTCQCKTNRVWDNVRQSCVKRCPDQENDCNAKSEICDTSGTIKKCKCVDASKWNPNRKACVRTCKNNSDCDTHRERCLMTAGGEGTCQCKINFNWNGIHERCAKRCNPEDEHSCDNQHNEYCSESEHHCSCKSPYKWNPSRSSCEMQKEDHGCEKDVDCAEREECNIQNGTGTCKCYSDHQKNNEGRCRFSCNSVFNCLSWESCLPDGNTSSCACMPRYMWANEYRGCVRDPACISDQQCSKRQRCSSHDGTGTCICSIDHHRNSFRQCIKPCVDDANCTSTEVCDRSEDTGGCECSSNHYWNQNLQRCARVTTFFIRQSSTESEVISTTTPDGISTTTNEPRSTLSPRIPDRACRRDRECSKRQRCSSQDGTGTCICSIDHHKDSMRKCIKSCVDDANCTSTEVCDRSGDTGKCVCSSNHKWDKRLQGCARVPDPACESDQQCSERHRCILHDSIGTCNCSADHQKDSSGQCIKSCVDDANCSSTEVCNRTEDTGRCKCLPNYEWVNELQACVKVYTCASTGDCPDRSSCLTYKRTCGCDRQHKKDLSGQCIRRCDNDTNCDSAEKCSAGSCICASDRIWSNKHSICVKECSPSNNVCTDIEESCEPIKGHHGCNCSPGYRWDIFVRRCILHPA